MPSLKPLIIVAFLFACSADDDLKQIPNHLQFYEIARLNGPLNEATGFVGSTSTNSLYIAFRDFNQDTEQLTEKIVRYHRANGKLTENFFDQADYVTKQLQIIDNELVVVGGSYINTYPLRLDDRPDTDLHGMALSRFGSALYENELYVWGGDLNGFHSDKIWKWLPRAEEFLMVDSLPGPKSWAEGEIVNGKLYVFGGQEQFNGTAPSNLVYIYDIEQKTSSITQLPLPLFRSFTSTHGSLIYVAGQLVDDDAFTDDINIFMGAFDTRDMTFHRISTSLSDDGYFTIHAITILNTNLYVIYGDLDDPQKEYRLMIADI